MKRITTHHQEKNREMASRAVKKVGKSACVYVQIENFMSRQPTMPSVSWETNSTPTAAAATTTATATPATEQSVTTTEEEKKNIQSTNAEKDEKVGEKEKGVAKHSVENYHQFDLQLENAQKPLAESEHLKTPTTRQRKGMSLTEYRKRYGAMQS